MTRDQGKLIEWFDDQGYGFIQPVDLNKKKVFLHISSFAKRGPRPIVGCALDYVVTIDQQGRYCAKDVIYLRSHRQKKVPNVAPSSAKLGIMPFVIASYWIFLSILTAFGKLSSLIIPFFILTNIISYYLYQKDKHAAQNNEWRVQEQTFHILAVLGGWSAAWYAQQNLRHKTQKQSFKSTYIATIILNIGLILFLASSYNTFLK